MEILEFCVQKLQAASVPKFEIFWERSSSQTLEVQDGKLDHLSQATDQGLAIRVLKDQRLGFSYTFDLSQDAVERAIRTAIEVASLMPADPYNDLVDLPASGFRPLANFDRRGLEVPFEKKLELALEIEASARRHDSRIRRVRKASFDQTSFEATLIDSSNRRATHEQTLFSAGLSCVAEEGSDAEIGHEAQYGCFYDEIIPTQIGNQAAALALELLHAGTTSTMNCPAVFRNSVVAQLIGFLSGSFSAENIDKNFSLLVGKLGDTLFSKKLTLIDDGLLPKGTSSAPFDGEGVPTQTTKLVDEGRIVNFMYDSYYARKHSKRSTGNCRRGSLKGPPGIGPSNLYLQGGTRSPAELIATVDKGIYITDVMGLHTANPVTGEFSFGASGLLIEKGELTRPVKGFAIAGNLVELLKNVSDVGSDLRFWGSVGTPSLLVSQLSVGGT